MKTSKIIISAALLLAAVSCQKFEQGCNLPAVENEAVEYGQLSVSINPSITVTTKGGYTLLDPSEKVVNSAQLLVFKSDGSLARYQSKNNPGQGTISFDSITLPVGQYRVYALLNAKPASGYTLESQVLLEEYSLQDNNDGLVQWAFETCTVVSGESAECSLEAKRLVARVRLVSVKNNLPAAFGAVTFENIFLENVVGTMSIEPPVNPSFLNKYGRADITNVASMIDGSTYQAEAPLMTFRNCSQQIVNNGTASCDYNLYCFGNTYDVEAPAVSTTFTPCATKLVLSVSILGQRYYYPVFVSTPRTVEENKTYSIAITLNNLGSSDPSVPVTLSTASVTITAADWDDGGSQNLQI